MLDFSAAKSQRMFTAMMIRLSLTILHQRIVKMVVERGFENGVIRLTSFLSNEVKKKLRSDKFRMHIGSPACHPRENHASFSRVYALKDMIRSLVQITLHEVAKLERPL